MKTIINKIKLNNVEKAIKKINLKTRKVTEFENAKTEEHEIHYSRYIASWYNVGGRFDTFQDRFNFYNWLESIGVNEDEAYDMWKMATCGKLELEESAKSFIEIR